MYNLPVTLSDGAWEKKYATVERSRFLEYANDEFASALRKLTSMAWKPK